MRANGSKENRKKLCDICMKMKDGERKKEGLRKNHAEYGRGRKIEREKEKEEKRGFRK